MHWYTDVLTKKYFDFEGRAQRQEYWMFTLINFLVVFGLSIVLGIIGLEGLAGLYMLAILIPSVALTIRRLHDINKSGWWILIALVPLIGSIVLLIFAIMDGTPGPNRFGVDPKGRGADMAAMPTAPSSEAGPVATPVPPNQFS